MSTHDVITLSPFTLGGGRCKTILGVEQGLGETLFEMYHFDTYLSYIYYYSIFFPVGKLFHVPRFDTLSLCFFISLNCSNFRVDFLSQYPVFADI